MPLYLQHISDELKIATIYGKKWLTLTPAQVSYIFPFCLALIPQWYTVLFWILLSSKKEVWFSYSCHIYVYVIYMCVRVFAWVWVYVSICVAVQGWCCESSSIVLPSSFEARSLNQIQNPYLVIQPTPGILSLLFGWKLQASSHTHLVFTWV